VKTASARPCAPAEKRGAWGLLLINFTVRVGALTALNTGYKKLHKLGRRATFHTPGTLSEITPPNWFGEPPAMAAKKNRNKLNIKELQYETFYN